jgi:glycosyltransferase involved in cell wall biosynthesis
MIHRRSDPTPRPRVLRIITRLNIGGPSIHAVKLSSALTPLGFDTQLIYGRVAAGEGEMDYLLGEEQTDATFLPTLQRSIAPAEDLQSLVRLFAHMRRFRPQIVHTHMAKAGVLGRVAAWLYNLSHPRSRAIVIHTYHGHVLEGYFSPVMTAMFISFERLLSKVTDVLIAVSPRVRQDLIEHHHIGTPSRFQVVPLGIDLDPFEAVGSEARRRARQALQIPDGAHVVTTVGRLTAIKQHALFLDVAARVHASDPQAVFLIAGDGELRGELEAQAAQLGLSSSVRFLGWRRDLTTIYGASDVFLLTSRNEGTPVALIEAMASGVAGVATDVGGVRDVLDDSELVRPFGDTEGLAKSVLTLLNDPERRAAAAIAGRRSVVARYHFRRLRDDIAALYHQLLA